jgi:hypothetical protein
LGAHGDEVWTEADQPAGFDRFPEPVARRQARGPRQIDDLFPQVEGQRAGHGNQRLDPLALQLGEGGLEVGSGAEVDRDDADAHRRRPIVQRLQRERHVGVAARAEGADFGQRRHDLLQQLQPLGIGVAGRLEGDTRHVSAGMRQRRDQPDLDRRADRQEHDRDRRRDGLGRHAAERSPGHQQIDLRQQCLRRLADGLRVGFREARLQREGLARCQAQRDQSLLPRRGESRLPGQAGEHLTDPHRTRRAGAP